MALMLFRGAEKIGKNVLGPPDLEIEFSTHLNESIEGASKVHGDSQDLKMPGWFSN